MEELSPTGKHRNMQLAARILEVEVEIEMDGFIQSNFDVNLFKRFAMQLFSIYNNWENCYLGAQIAVKL